MTESWQALKQQLEIQTNELLINCPDEIKRFHYGIITHSDAGKRSFNQYFGHWVHLYGYYFMNAESIVANLIHTAEDSHFNLVQVKELVRLFTPHREMMTYNGQTILGEFGSRLIETLDTINTKTELAELLRAWNALFTRLYWWIHWYFPWGIGPSLCPRHSAEDIEEMVRLSKTD